MKIKCLLAFAVIICFSDSLCAREVEQWDRFEISFQYKSVKNSFRDVTIAATFVHKDTSIQVVGFYDGNDVFRIRFMPSITGEWTFVTRSNISQLNKQKGGFTCTKPSVSNHGMVKTSGPNHFRYSDGRLFYPFGTTAYAWTHMDNGVQEETLRSLSQSGFNKIRMCVFPKNYELVKEEPPLYPFVVKDSVVDSKGQVQRTWDFENFNPLFFQHLEKRIDDLRSLGIEADLIIFHPYDKGRWGFDDMTEEVNIRYIRYLAARLSSFRNVWWSLANEWDYVKSKTVQDWIKLSETIVAADPYGHLRSIHGATATYFDYWMPLFTHVSVQDETPVQSLSSAALLRNIYHKPIVYDEVGYEGNLKSRWGRYSGEEMMNLIWNGVMAGAYVTHGESYMFKDARDTIFWAKGGRFKGSSWKRVAFLRSLVEQCPNPPEMADISRDHITTTAGDGYYLIYFGKQITDAWLFNLPAKNSSYKKLAGGVRFKVEIIDTWDMTITEYPIRFETADENDYRLFDKNLQKVRLPLKPYLALRITKVQ